MLQSLQNSYGPDVMKYALMLKDTNYAQNYAGMMYTSLQRKQ